MTDEGKFYVGGLPSAPFDYYWQVEQRMEESHLVYYDTAYPRNERIETFMVPVRDNWNFNMVSYETGVVERRAVITELTDGALYDAAEKLSEEYLVHNRAKALEEGPKVVL
jgi:hypothetical protein